MNAIRTTLATLALAAAGIAQAAEYTNFPLEPSVRSRAEVRAEIVTETLTLGEAYDGTHLAATAAPRAIARSRSEVRSEAIAALRAPESFDYIGG